MLVQWRAHAKPQPRIIVSRPHPSRPARAVACQPLQRRSVTWRNPASGQELMPSAAAGWPTTIAARRSGNSRSHNQTVMRRSRDPRRHIGRESTKNPIGLGPTTPATHRLSYELNTVLKHRREASAEQEVDLISCLPAQAAAPQQAVHNSRELHGTDRRLQLAARAVYRGI